MKWAEQTYLCERSDVLCEWSDVSYEWAYALALGLGPRACMTLSRALRHIALSWQVAAAAGSAAEAAASASFGRTLFITFSSSVCT